MPRHRRPAQSGSEKDAPRHQTMDELCKLAMEVDRGRLLALVLPPPICQHLGLPAAPPRLIEILPTELRRRRLHADYLVLVEMDGRRVLLHVEFQNRPDARMPRRILRYQAAAADRHWLPVYSIVLNVFGGGAALVRIEQLELGALRTCWVTVTVAAAAAGWTADVSSPIALLLGALTASPSDEELGRCLQRLRELGVERETCRELLTALCFLLDVRQYGGTHSEETRQRLFMKLRMEETWLYQEGVQKGIDEMHQALIERCRERFGVDEVGEARIHRLREPRKLMDLMARVATAPTLAEALSGLPPA